MGNCTKGARVLVTKKVPSVTECQLRTFRFRSHLPCLCHQPTSTPAPSQPCWTTSVSPAHWTLPHLVPLLSAFLSLYTFFLLPAVTSTSFSSPVLLWGLQWPCPAPSPLAVPPGPTASCALLWSASQYSVLSPAVNSPVNRRVPPWQVLWLCPSLWSPLSAPALQVGVQKIKWLLKLFALPCTTFRNQAVSHWNLHMARYIFSYF